MMPSNSTSRGASPQTMPPRAIITILLCLLVATFEGIDLQAAGVVAPQVVPLFHFAVFELKWFLAASTIGLVVGALVGGRVADLWGRKAALMISIALFGIFSVATALAASKLQLIEARFLTGLGLGGALPNLIALTAESAPPHQKRFAVAMMYIGMPLGGGGAGLLSLIGANGSGWQDMFYIGGIAPLLLLPLLAWLLRESSEFRTVHAAKSSLGIGQGLWANGRAVQSLLLWTSFFAALLVLYLLLNWLPSLLVARGLTRVDASWIQVAFNLVGAVGVVLSGALLARSPRVTVLVFFGGTILGLVLLATVPAQFGVELLAGSLVGAAVLGCQSMLYAIAPGLYPTALRGTGVGAAVSAGRLGSVAGPLVAGIVLQTGGSASSVLTYLLPVSAVGLITSMILVRKISYQDPKLVPGD